MGVVSVAEQGHKHQRHACCLSLSMLGNFSCYCCCLLIFFIVNFSKNYFRNTTRMSNSLEPDQARHSTFCRPDLASNCLHRLSADEKSRRPLARKELFTFEPVHEISNNVVCATSETSDQPAHTRSLIRAFASRLNIL